MTTDATDPARVAIAAREWSAAATHLEAELDAVPGLGADRATLLLALVGARKRAGRPDAAWVACRAAAAIARVVEDPLLLADAALAAPIGDHGAWPLVAEHHALAVEARAAIGDTDPVRLRRLDALVAATTDTWSSAVAAPPAVDVCAGPEERFSVLRARYEALLHIRHAEERMALATDAASLGGPDRDEYLAWSALWEASAATQLGRRQVLDEAVRRLTDVVPRLRQPVWDWRLGTVRAAVALLEGDTARTGDEAGGARAAAGDHPGREVGFVDLIFRSQIAMRIGRGLDGIDAELARVLVGMPYGAHGWRAETLLAAGRREEAEAIWRAIRGTAGRQPESPIEWVISTSNFGRLAVAFADAEIAGVVRIALAPYAGMQLAADAQTPSAGPVSLLLGRLATVQGDLRAASAHLALAIREAEAVHDPWHAALARHALAELGQAAGPLSAREAEIARLVADGLGNRMIAERLQLSVRTVENHVAHALQKLGTSSRSGITAWVLRRERF